MKLSILSILIVLAGWAITAQAQDDYVAMIADIEGSASINTMGESQVADILIELTAGSQLQLEEGAKLTLFYFESSQEYSFVGPAQVSLEAQSPKILAGVEAESRNLNMAKLADIAAEDEGSIGLGVLKLRNFEKPKLQLLEPVDAIVLTKDVRFSWLAVEGASSYEFILSDELGKRIADTQVSTNSISLPSDTQLTPGAEYTWEIITQTSDQTEYRAHAYFNVAEDYLSNQVEEARPSASAGFAEKVVFARLLEKLGLKPAANALWQELAALKPNSAVLQTRSEAVSH